MSGAVCPACGIAVVPGYVKCPKCHKPLPRFARSTLSPVGGTAVPEAKSKTLTYAVAAFAAVVVLLVVRHYVVTAFEDYRSNGAAMRHRDGGAEVAVTEPVAPAPVANVVTPPAAAPTTPQPTVHADDIAIGLKRRLDKQRLWATVTVIGERVDVRSTACGDGGMKPAIEQSAAQFHAAGLTHLRCVEQSGAVVFSRDL